MTEFTFRLPAPVDPEIDLICPKCKAMGCPDGPHDFRRYFSASGTLTGVACKGCGTEIGVESYGFNFSALARLAAGLPSPRRSSVNWQ